MIIIQSKTKKAPEKSGVFFTRLEICSNICEENVCYHITRNKSIESVNSKRVLKTRLLVARWTKG